MSHPASLRALADVAAGQTKLKSRKSVVKRFFRTKSGLLKYWPAGRNHNSSGKNRRRLKHKRRPRYVTGVHGMRRRVV